MAFELRVELVLVGAGVEPDDVSRLLGDQPASIQRVGDRLRGGRNSQVGLWVSHPFAGHPASVEEKIEHLLDYVESRSGAIRELITRHEAAVRALVAIHLHPGRPGPDAEELVGWAETPAFGLSPETSRRLAASQIELDVNIEIF